MHSQTIWFGLIVASTLGVGCGKDVASDAQPVLGDAANTAAGSLARASAGASAVGNAGGSAGRAAADGGVPSMTAGRGPARGQPDAGRSASPAARGASAGGGGMSAGAAGSAMRAGQGGGAAAIGGGAGAGDASYAPCPVNDVCKILPLGDSITYGIGYDGGYRVELFHKAHADAKQITFTGSLSNGPMQVDGATFPRNNEGHSGWKIDQLLPLLPMPALQQLPNIVLLMIGTNDIAQNDDLANAPERLGGLLDKLIMNAPDALIVVAKLTPLSSSSAVQTYNDALPAVVEKRSTAGKHVVWVDQFGGFPTSELGDGVHPNQQGYERMASVWYDAIGTWLR